jgi:alpha-L-fucosidase
MPNGIIQPEFVDTLKIIGTWLEKNGESIYGTRGNLIAPQGWGVVTSKDKLLYAHILNKPKESYIFIPGLKGKVISATTLSDKKKLNIKQITEGVFVYVDPLTLNDTDEIIRLQIQ